MRLVGWAVGFVLLLLLLVFSAVQIEQRMLRWHAERLSAEMHQIRLYQSTWGDAQRLMLKWGAWGHYDGSCTVSSCQYEIEMESSGFSTPRAPRHVWLDWLFTHDRLNLYSWLGGQGSAFQASFTVHDGTIWRQRTAFGVVVSRRGMRRENDFDRTLSLGRELSKP